jgi:hypothetical protein
MYSDKSISLTCCYEWIKQSKDGHQSTDDEPHLGRPLTSCDDAHVVEVCGIMLSNHHLTVQEIAEECNMSVGCHDILTTKLEIHGEVSKFVPRLPTQDQGDSHVAICQDSELC